MSAYTLPTSKQALGLAAWLGVTFIAAAFGAKASIDAQTFYQQLTLPSWAPPGWLFGPVWTVLYGLMGVAAWLVWRDYGFAGAKTALTLYLTQLVFNALWSWTFFAWAQGALSFGVLVVLWLLIAATLYQFWRLKPLAGYLLLPYIAWVSFAGVLNFTVWQLNPTLL